MAIEWHTMEAKEQLLAATVAASKHTLDYTMIATYFGHGATYHSVEKQFRKIREIGEELKGKAELGGNAMAAGPGAKIQAATTRKTNPASTKEKTEGGRISKATKTGANKKKGGVKGRGGRKDQAVIEEIAVGESANGEEALLGGEEDAYFDGYYDPELLNQGV